MSNMTRKEEELKEEQEEEQVALSSTPRGVLNMILPGPLLYYNYDQEILDASTQSLKRHRRPLEQQRIPSTLKNNIHATTSEFTLLFFGDSTCRHSLRVRPILVEEFLLENSNNNECQCIIVPNDTAGSHSEELFMAGTGCFCLSMNHPNRLGIIR
mmetsp:Transcript_14027/g.21303  ORF Transcript_14027/g.21303 Transcript_14027/m.21303 type:complete len:156 (-) Transcript_14027:69-536(-)